MKKILILLLTLIFCASGNTLFSAKTQALHKDENGVNWWFVEELLNLPEKDNSVDVGYEEDEESAALRMLRGGRFWITSIDPSEEIVKVLYFDEDEDLRRWGIEEKQPLDFIFLAWFDHENGEIGNYNHNLPIEPQFSETPHLLYAGDAEPFNTEYFPSNQPIELPLNSTNLKDNHLGIIYAATFGENYNSKGYFDYSSCFENYEEGDTCELVFSPGHGYAYLPVKEKTMYVDGLGEITYIEKYPKEENEEVEENIIAEEKPEEKEIEEKEKTDDSLIRNIPKTPNTGNYTNGCEKKVEFPWWIVPILVLGDAAVLWLFLPQKSQKKSKKHLTKNLSCDKMGTV